MSSSSSSSSSSAAAAASASAVVGKDPKRVLVVVKRGSVQAEVDAHGVTTLQGSWLIWPKPEGVRRLSDPAITVAVSITNPSAPSGTLKVANLQCVQEADKKSEHLGETKIFNKERDTLPPWCSRLNGVSVAALLTLVRRETPSSPTSVRLRWILAFPIEAPASNPKKGAPLPRACPGEAKDLCDGSLTSLNCFLFELTELLYTYNGDNKDKDATYWVPDLSSAYDEHQQDEFTGKLEKDLKAAMANSHPLTGFEAIDTPGVIPSLFEFQASKGGNMTVDEFRVKYLELLQSKDRNVSKKAEDHVKALVKAISEAGAKKAKSVNSVVPGLFIGVRAAKVSFAATAAAIPPSPIRTESAAVAGEEEETHKTAAAVVEVPVKAAAPTRKRRRISTYDDADDKSETVDSNPPVKECDTPAVQVSVPLPLECGTEGLSQAPDPKAWGGMGFSEDSPDRDIVLDSQPPPATTPITPEERKKKKKPRTGVTPATATAVAAVVVETPLQPIPAPLSTQVAVETGSSSSSSSSSSSVLAVRFNPRSKTRASSGTGGAATSDPATQAAAVINAHVSDLEAKLEAALLATDSVTKKLTEAQADNLRLAPLAQQAREAARAAESAAQRLKTTENERSDLTERLATETATSQGLRKDAQTANDGRDRLSASLQSIGTKYHDLEVRLNKALAETTAAAAENLRVKGQLQTAEIAVLDWTARFWRQTMRLNALNKTAAKALSDECMEAEKFAPPAFKAQCDKLATSCSLLVSTAFPVTTGQAPASSSSSSASAATPAPSSKASR